VTVGAPSPDWPPDPPPAGRPDGPLRRALDRVYAASGVVAAGFLAAIVAVVLIQVLFNVADAALAAVTGAPAGLLLPSYAEFAGYFLAASTFFALAYTLRAGAHIRVTLVVGRLPPRARRLAEVWCCAAGAGLAGAATLAAGRMTWESWRFGDVSYGLVPIPTFLPQTAMTAGLALLTVALVDAGLAAARGRTPPDAGEPG